MPKGFSTPRSFRGDGDIRTNLERNWRQLLTWLNNQLPIYELDGTTLNLPGDVNVTGNVNVGAGSTVDGVDISTHVHDNMDGSTSIDHGSQGGLIDDDHTHYVLVDGTRAMTGALTLPSNPTSGLHAATKQYVDSQQVKVSKTAAQTLTTGSAAMLTWNTETEDDWGGHSNVTNNTRITADVAGIYACRAWVAFATNSTGYREVVIFRNGSEVVDTKVRFGARSGVNTYALSIVNLKMSANDYVEVRALQNSGGDLDVASASTFAVTRLSRA